MRYSRAKREELTEENQPKIVSHLESLYSESDFEAPSQIVKQKQIDHVVENMSQEIDKIAEKLALIEELKKLEKPLKKRSKYLIDCFSKLSLLNQETEPVTLPVINIEPEDTPSSLDDFQA